MSEYNFNKIIDRRGTLSVKYETREEMFGNAKVLPMWIADMDIPTPNFILDALTERLAHPVLGYSVVDEAFYGSIIEWFDSHYSTKICREDILLTQSVLHAIALAIQTFSKQGDYILIQPPVYHPFERIIHTNNRQLLQNTLVQTHDVYQVDIVDFRNKIEQYKPKIFILCNPHNPVGRSWSKKELTEMAQICVQNNVLLVSDEIHSDLLFDDRQHVPIIQLSDEIANNSFLLHSTTKTFNTATIPIAECIISNKAHKHKMELALLQSKVDPLNLLAIIASHAAYSEGEAWRKQLIKYLQNNRDIISRTVQNKIPNISMTQCEATYLGWLNFNKLNLSEKKLQEMMYHEAELGLSYGGIFGEGGEGFFRINFAVSQATLEDGLQRLIKTFS